MLGWCDPNVGAKSQVSLADFWMDRYACSYNKGPTRFRERKRAGRHLPELKIAKFMRTRGSFHKPPPRPHPHPSHLRGKRVPESDQLGVRQHGIKTPRALHLRTRRTCCGHHQRPAPRTPRSAAPGPTPGWEPGPRRCSPSPRLGTPLPHCAPPPSICAVTPGRWPRSTLSPGRTDLALCRPPSQLRTPPNLAADGRGWVGGLGLLGARSEHGDRPAAPYVRAQPTGPPAPPHARCGPPNPSGRGAGLGGGTGAARCPQRARGPGSHAPLVQKVFSPRDGSRGGAPGSTGTSAPPPPGLPVRGQRALLLSRWDQRQEQGLRQESRDL